MSRAGWALFTLSWAWGLYLVAFVVTYERAFPRNISPVELIGLILLTLAIFSNLVLWASRTVDQSNPVPTSWRVLLVGFLAVNISVAFFLADFRALFGYWLWVTGFAVRTWALLALPPDTAAPKSSDSALSDDSVPEIVLVALGVTIFWLGVTVVNYYQFNRHLPRKAEVVKNPTGALTSYFTDPAHLFQTGEQQHFTSWLAAYDQQTSNQIAVAIYPRVPDSSVDDFTIRTAEASGLGRKSVDNGVILFVFMAERAARIEVGYGLESTLTDAMSRRILDTELAPRFARGEYAEGIDGTLAAIRNVIDAESRKVRLQDFLRRLYPQLKVAVVRTARHAWPLARDAPLEARLGVSFFGILLGFGVWSGIVNAAKMLWCIAVGVSNLIRRRPFRHGMLPVAFEPMWDTLKLAVILAVISGTYVVVAGQGSFGGGGALIHWPRQVAVAAQ